MDKLTLTKLIAEADQIKGKARAKQDMFIKSLGGTVTIQEPERSVCLDAMDMGAAGDDYLVLECVIEPNLKDAGLMQAFGCTTPLEVVTAIFKPGETAQIAKAAVDMAGYGADSVQAVENLKN